MKKRDLMLSLACIYTLAKKAIIILADDSKNI